MFDGLFNSALECHKAGNFHGAISEYKAIHEKWPNHFDTVQLLGVALAQIGDFSSALQYFDEALLINAESYAVFNNKGNALKAIGKTDAAINCYQSAIALNSNYYEARFNLATLFLEIKNYGEARDQLLKCIELRKNSSRSFYALGVAYSGLKQNENAIKLFGQCLETDNRYTDAYVARGLELIKSKKHEEAIIDLEFALKLNPKNADALLNIGDAHQQINKINDALNYYQKCLAVDPKQYYAFHNMGELYLKRGNYNNAIEMFESALLINPNHHISINSIGSALLSLEKPSDALLKFENALNINPDYTPAINNTGLALMRLEKYSMAAECFKKVINRDPQLADAHNNYGILLQENGEFKKALDCYDNAIKINPNQPEYNWNKSILLLLIGDYSNGWNLYEWRCKNIKTGLTPRPFKEPLWLGFENISGTTILLHAEQGLGDTIHFCRYVGMVKGFGARVILEVQRPLIPLLRSLKGIDSIVAHGDEIPHFDYHIPLLSLPLAFKTTAESIPIPIPYLYTEKSRVSKWKSYLGDRGFKIAVCWKGSNIGRSFSPTYLEKISKIKNVRLISVQKLDNCELDECKNINIEFLPENFDPPNESFLDTAAVMQCCDLVITCDTSIGHIAGALGLKTWIALKFVPDMRWMLGRNDSPWYPSVRLFRQSSIGDWNSVFTEIEVQLGNLYDQR